MPLNDPFVELTPVSSVKLNSMVIISLSGSAIAALSATAIDGQIVYCNTTGSGFTAGRWYGWDDAASTWRDLRGIDHPLNVADTYGIEWPVVDMRTFGSADWTLNSSGTGASATYQTGSPNRVNLVTGTTSTGWADMKCGSLHLDFGSQALFIVGFKTPAQITGSIVKIGCGMDRAGTSNTTNRQFGIEYCDGSANWMIHTADGTDQSNQDTGWAVPTSTSMFFYTWYTGSQDYYVYNSNVSDDDRKSDDIATGSSDGGDRIISVSISNNAGNTTSKTMEVYAAYILYEEGVSYWTW